MIHVLFVCLGNICRSPMAEAVFTELVKKDGFEDRFQIDSAGLGGWHVGKPPHHGTQDILTKNKISFEGLVARQFQGSDLEAFDYIIAMDDENIAGINRLKQGNPSSYVAKLMDFVPEAREDEVPDPYYTGNFDYVYSLVTEGCQELLKHIKKEHNLA